MLRMDGDFFINTRMKSLFDHEKMKDDQEYKIKLLVSLKAGSIIIFIYDVDMGYGTLGEGQINEESELYFTVSSYLSADVEILPKE